MSKKTKILSLKEAVGLIKDGDQVWLGGWTVVRHPMAMVYEIIRQQKKNLYLCSNPGAPDFDMLIGAGCVYLGETNYIGHEVFGHPYCFRRAIEKDTPRYLHDDWTVQTGALRILAGSMGVPFLPTLALKGSDLVMPEFDSVRDLRGVDPKLPKAKVSVVKDPFWEGEDVFLVPALRPDVCLIHAQEVGEKGTVRIKGGNFLDYYAALASKLVIVSAEKIVPDESLRDEQANAIPDCAVDIIVEAPYGAHPTAVFGCYDNDPWWFKEYLAASKDADKMNQWLKEWVLDVGSHEGYLEKLGTKRLNHISSDPQKGYNPTIRRRMDKLGEV
ncbi:hypothetical protein M7775_13065 [Sporomusa sphaeroides DSM 2875]|uniref:CoA transferase subunit A n=1 Tax=Sporomusa sphaeroides TaxID=47679 RepID=UPI00202EE606|nr:hypothetical protein [Sporomusa sphaeroides DSM 2875]